MDNPEAEYRLGYCYRFGRGIQQDHFQAVKWFQKAAEHRNAIVDHLPHTFTFRSEKKAEQVVNAISDAGGIAISGIADGDEDDDE